MVSRDCTVWTNSLSFVGAQHSSPWREPWDYDTRMTSSPVRGDTLLRLALMCRPAGAVVILGIRSHGSRRGLASAALPGLSY